MLIVKRSAVAALVASVALGILPVAASPAGAAPAPASTSATCAKVNTFIMGMPYLLNGIDNAVQNLPLIPEASQATIDSSRTALVQAAKEARRASRNAKTKELLRELITEARLATTDWSIVRALYEEIQARVDGGRC